MRPETKIALNDALAAAEEVIEIGATGLDDRITGLAVERLLLIGGEAMVRVRDFRFSGARQHPRLATYHRNA